MSCKIVTNQKGASASRQVIRINTDFPYAPVTASPAHLTSKSCTGKRKIWFLPESNNGQGI